MAEAQRQTGALGDEFAGEMVAVDYRRMAERQEYLALRRRLPTEAGKERKGLGDIVILNLGFDGHIRGESDG